MRSPLQLALIAALETPPPRKKHPDALYSFRRPSARCVSRRRRAAPADRAPLASSPCSQHKGASSPPRRAGPARPRLPARRLPQKRSKSSPMRGGNDGASVAFSDHFYESIFIEIRVEMRTALARRGRWLHTLPIPSCRSHRNACRARCRALLAALPSAKAVTRRRRATPAVESGTPLVVDVSGFESSIEIKLA